MYPLKSFNNQQRNDVRIIRTQSMSLSAVNPNQDITVSFPEPFVHVSPDQNPTISLQVISGDGNVYSSHIVQVNKSSLTFSIYPAVLYAPKYRFYKFIFTRTAGTNAGTLTNVINLGRIRFYSSPNIMVDINPSFVTSIRSSAQAADKVYNLTEPLNYSIGWVNSVALGPIDVSIKLDVAVSISAYEFISPNVNVRSLPYNSQPGSWTLSYSLDDITYTELHRVDKFCYPVKQNTARSMFHLPVSQPSAVDVTILASL